MNTETSDVKKKAPAAGFHSQKNRRRQKMSRATGTAVLVIEKAVRKVWPDYKFPHTREHDATLTNELRVAVDRALQDLLNTIEFELYCDEAVLCTEDAAHAAWLHAQIGGYVIVCARASIAASLPSSWFCITACCAQCDEQHESEMARGQRATLVR